MTPQDAAGIVSRFVGGKVSLHDAIRETGKSRATIYRYARAVSQGQPLEDKRKYGNNRKYGKKLPNEM